MLSHYSFLFSLMNFLSSQAHIEEEIIMETTINNVSSGDLEIDYMHPLFVYLFLLCSRIIQENPYYMVI